MKVNCDNCGKRFSRAPRYLKNTKKHFCKRKCYLEYREKTGYGVPGKVKQKNDD